MQRPASHYPTRVVTGYTAQADELGRVFVELEITQPPPSLGGSGRTMAKRCEIAEADLVAAATARGAESWTVEDVKTVTGCTGIRM